MHLWHKLAEPHWLRAHENVLQARSRGRLVIISRPGRKRLQLEISCPSRTLSRKLIEEFGGRTEKWPRDWLKRFAELHKSKPLKIGKRLLISTTPLSPMKRGTSHKPGRSRHASGATYYRVRDSSSSVRVRRTSDGRPTARDVPLLVIPASAAFGTGGHATTAMSLRFLERLTRKWKRGWSLADLGTGTGIFALAAKRFGAGRVIGIDIDPKAISIAKANARLNKIENVNFRLGDLRAREPIGSREIIAANLYSELLLDVLPKLKACNWLILSGVLRKEENEFLGVLRLNKIKVIKVNRRGKWIAVLANGSDRLPLSR
jgi:ribosomal protein L11 methyltransferase